MGVGGICGWGYVCLVYWVGFFGGGLVPNVTICPFWWVHLKNGPALFIRGEKRIVFSQRMQGDVIKRWNNTTVPFVRKMEDNIGFCHKRMRFWKGHCWWKLKKAQIDTFNCNISNFWNAMWLTLVVRNLEDISMLCNNTRINGILINLMKMSYSISWLCNTLCFISCSMGGHVYQWV